MTLDTLKNFRFGDTDTAALARVAEALGQTQSETIRQLIHRADRALTKAKNARTGADDFARKWGNSPQESQQ